MADDHSADIENLSLSKSAEFLFQECRMVLPGIQALFGFQLIAVFNRNFPELLAHSERVIHLIAITLVAMAIALIMTPAAFQRQTSPQHVSKKFLQLSTRLLLISMPLLCGGICIDFYLVAKIILADALLALVIAGCMLAFFVALWFVLPRMRAFK